MDKDIVIDRFEGDHAVCLRGRKVFRIPASLLPSGAAEGCVIVKTKNGYSVDCDRTLQRRKEADRLTNEVFKED
ncbi:MAG: DUF3006 domain-containing protein [Bacillota bacterium]|nr:DUF3006 domain-containing protein [Bacillota bacterium]